MAMKYKLSTTQLKWIVSALQHEIISCRDEMEAADDGSPVQSLGEMLIETRSELVTQLQDIIHSGTRRIEVY